MKPTRREFIAAAASSRNLVVAHEFDTPGVVLANDDVKSSGKI